MLDSSRIEYSLNIRFLNITYYENPKRPNTYMSISSLSCVSLYRESSYKPHDTIDIVIIILSHISIDGYYVAYKPITLPCISFMFIEMKFIHCHSYVMFVIKSMSIYDD